MRREFFFPFADKKKESKKNFSTKCCALLFHPKNGLNLTAAEKLHRKKGMEELMTEAEQKAAFIEEFTKLQRIKAAPDKDDEINYQIKTVKAKLETMGVNVEDLTK